MGAAGLAVFSGKDSSCSQHADWAQAGEEPFWKNSEAA